MDVGSNAWDGRAESRTERAAANVSAPGIEGTPAKTPGNADAAQAGWREATVEEILRTEWEMFQAVNGVGGPARCQSMPRTFALMRAAQFSVWTDALLSSYGQDVAQAKAAGRNLMTEKYGYMMEETDPAYFVRELEARLPRTGEEERAAIDEILAQNRRWEREVQRRFPHVAQHARAAEGAAGGSTSVDVYARGELRTCSLRTLRLYRDLVRAAVAAGRNLALEERDAIARGYGFASVDALEAALAQAQR